jgi:hypothetical protein
MILFSRLRVKTFMKSLDIFVYFQETSSGLKMLVVRRIKGFQANVVNFMLYHLSRVYPSVFIALFPISRLLFN